MTALAATYGLGLWYRARGNTGEVAFWQVLGVLVLIVAYLTNPELFHNFFKWTVDLFFDELHKAFGTGEEKGK